MPLPPVAPQGPPSSPPTMRAPTRWEQLRQGLEGAYSSLQEQPLLQFLAKLGQSAGAGIGALGDEFQTMGQDPQGTLADWRPYLQQAAIGATLGPTAGPPGARALGRFRDTRPIAGTTLDEILAAGEAQYPAARSLQVIEPGTGAVLDPVREAALQHARRLAGK